MPREYTFTFPLKNGLHARPASQIQELVQRFHSQVTLVNEHNRQTANAKSALALVATATMMNDSCRLLVAGEDESEAFSAIVAFMQNQFLHIDDNLIVPPSQQTGHFPPPHILTRLSSHFFSGLPAAPGCVQAKVQVISSFPAFDISPARGMVNPQEEVASVRQAIGELSDEILVQVRLSKNSTATDILKIQLAILQDSDFLGRIGALIEEKKIAAALALQETGDFYSRTLQESGSAYLQERISDIRDITRQIMLKIYGPPAGLSPTALSEPVIVAADFLTPSQILALDRNFLRGLAFNQGGIFSHTAILARAFRLPCVVSLRDIQHLLQSGQEAILDGNRGLLIPQPPESVCRYYLLEQQREISQQESNNSFIALRAETADGRHMEIGGNVGSLEELASAFRNGAEGIGLFRTEFLFLNREQPPSEEDQFAIYRQAVETARGKPVTMRTLDVGGDKELPYLRLVKEENPFLGYRGVRLYQDYPDIVRAQLRAILRASAFGRLKILIPMIATLAEIRLVKEWLKELGSELERKNIPHDQAIPLGAMIEIPASAFLIEHLSREVDYFSIGTNDLTQYVMAACRNNDRLLNLYDTRQPAFLRLLAHITSETRRLGKWIGMCGEMAGSRRQLPLLVGLGLDEISMMPARIPEIKVGLRRLHHDPCVALLEKVLRCGETAEVEALLQQFTVQGTEPEIVNPRLILLNSPSRNAEEAVKEMVNLLILNERVENGNEVEDLIWQREEKTSTAIGTGVAVPHCQSPAVGAASVVLLRPKIPIPWPSPESTPVELVILLALPAGEGAKKHLRLIAGLSRRLMHDEFRQSLLSAADEEQVSALLRECL